MASTRLPRAKLQTQLADSKARPLPLRRLLWGTPSSHSGTPVSPMWGHVVKGLTNASFCVIVVSSWKPSLVHRLGYGLWFLVPQSCALPIRACITLCYYCPSSS